MVGALNDCSRRLDPGVQRRGENQRGDVPAIASIPTPPPHILSL